METLKNNFSLGGNFKQTNPKVGCAAYALANLLNNARYISEKRLNQNEKGISIHMLNEWLNEENTGFYIKPHYESDINQLPPWNFQLIPERPGIVLPLLLDVKHSNVPTRHLVACFATFEGEVHVIDSLEKYSFSVNWPMLMSGLIFRFIQGVYVLKSFESKQENEFIMFKKNKK